MKSILVVNFGSSSIKFKLYNHADLKNVASGMIEVNRKNGIFEISSETGNVNESIDAMNHEQASSLVFDTLQAKGIIKNKEDIAGIGHRVVHGADLFIRPTVIKEQELKKLEGISHMAPLHNPIAVSALKIIGKLMPNAINVACFDTAFHADIPEVNWTYPVPKEWIEKFKVRKYGMHGISYQYVTKKIEEVTGKKANVIICHLGSGSSVCVVRDSKSFDTSMGLTPLAGIMMGKRSGDIDPSIMSFMVRQTGQTADQIEWQLNNASGVYGLTGISDMRELAEAVQKGVDKQAVLAAEMWTDRIANYVVRYYNAAECKIDGLVFTAGIGENSAFWVQKIVGKIKAIKLSLNKEAFEKKYSDQQKVSGEVSQLAVYRIRTNEELMIAQSVKELVG